MGPKPNDKCPYKRKAEGDPTQAEEEEEMRSQRQIVDYMATSQGMPTATGS